MSGARDRTFVVSAVVLRDDAGRILAVRKRDTAAFMLPGGKLEAGETPGQAALRELAEEVGLELEGVTPLARYVAPAANEPGWLVDASVFTATLPGPAAEVGAAAEIDEVRWLDPWRLDEMPTASVAPLLRDVLPDLTTYVVVGIGADGWPGLAEAARERVAGAALVVGSRRQLELLPPTAAQERRAWDSPLDLALLDERLGRPVVVLASGDPLLSGIGSTLIARYGRRRVEVVPGVSSPALARARLGWSAEESETITLVGRDPSRLRRHLAPGRRLLVLSSDAATPDVVAALLTEAGYGASVMTALGDLGAACESWVEGRADAWRADVSALHVLGLELVGTPSHAPGGAPGRAPGNAWSAGRPDTDFEHDGQLTKRDLRASALARLAPRPGQLLWDVGAGAGSIGIEWLLAHPTCRAVAVEADPERAERIARNARRHGVPELTVVSGRAPAVLDRPWAGEAPDAIFVGGGAGAPGLLDRCRAALRPGGRLVVHAVTLETERVLLDAHAEHGGELTRIAVETAAPIGSFTGWTPARAVVQWAWSRP